MIGFTLDTAKKGFFDAQAVIAATSRAERKNLSKFGAFVRQTARNSIKFRSLAKESPIAAKQKKKRGRPSKSAYSLPGNPPFYHTHGFASIRSIFFAYEHATRNVVIGPVKINGGTRDGKTPSILEYGGARLLTNRRTKKRKLASYAPRPFMRPAFNKELTTLPAMWRDSIKPY